MNSNNNDIDTRICPLCGQPNHCAMAEPRTNSAQPCWCKTEYFSPLLLDKVPEEARSRACICRACLQSTG